MSQFRARVGEEGHAPGEGNVKSKGCEKQNTRSVYKLDVNQFFISKLFSNYRN